MQASYPPWFWQNDPCGGFHMDLAVLWPDTAGLPEISMRLWPQNAHLHSSLASVIGSLLSSSLLLVASNGWDTHKSNHRPDVLVTLSIWALETNAENFSGESRVTGILISYLVIDSGSI